MFAGYDKAARELENHLEMEVLRQEIKELHQRLSKVNAFLRKQYGTKYIFSDLLGG